MYELEHLATFEISPKQGMNKPMDGIRRLHEMEATTGVWKMKVLLRIDRREIVVVEKSTDKVCVGKFFFSFWSRIISSFFKPKIYIYTSTIL